jgi:hypothetical protein
MRAHAVVLSVSAAALVASLSAGWIASAAEPSGPPLPRGFRAWKHVRSLAVTDPEHPMHGFHDGYANDAALRGMRAKPPRYEDGATFVVSIFEIAEQRGITTAGAKRRDVVQVKDRRATATGGWRFAAYDPAGRPIAVDEAACFSCHAAAKDTDHVLTSLRD